MKYGLIGERLGHSFSKIIHEELTGLEYTLTEVARDELDSFITRRDFSAINVTLPYKQSVIPYLDFIDGDAAAIGAVNTVVNRNGRLYGYNTDFYGMKMLFAHAGIDAQGKKAVILGSGGTSKTAYAVLTSLGAREILRVSRSARDGAIDYDELISQHSDAEIIVNTTPKGMYPDICGMPVDLSHFSGLIGVVDAVYNPIRTPFVLSALARKIPAEGGLYMLVAQAVRASEIFHGKEYPDGTVDRVFERICAMKENIVLIGMPACGKSTVGAILAKRLSRRLVDTDELVRKRAGMEIKEIFKKYGEAEFRRLEREVISEISGENSLVIATGGGAILYRENVSGLKKNGRLYFIDRPPELLIPTSSRPLSSDRQALEKRYSERYPIYCSVADVRVDADCTPECVAEKITENF